LQLDPQNAASRRATATFLPTRVAPASGGGVEPAEGLRTLALMSFLVAPAGDSPALRNAIGAAAAAVCRNLPGLAQSGHPKWREVRPGMVLETDWPRSAVASDIFQVCAEPASRKP
jgi:hypothetical protein